MSSLAVGGHMRIDGPLPRVRPRSLLTVPDVLVEETDEHWKSGVAIYGYPEEVPELWEGCSDGTFRTKDEGSAPPTPVFTSFVMYIPISCSAMGIGDPDEFAERAAAVMRATQAYGAEKALAQGIIGLDNPYLGDANLQLLASGVNASVGLAYLEDAIGQTGRQGLIHLTPAVAARIEEFTDRGLDEPLYTGVGTPVAIGSGYIGTDPVNQVSPGATTDWVFATGPVEVRIEDDVTLVPEGVAEAVERSVNDVVYRAEKVAVVSWDTALQAGVLVDWSL